MTDTEELDRLAASITPGPWKWWTSNSYKRLMQDIGRDSKPVIEPYVCRDGCPDISISQALMTAIALLPELLAEVIATRRASGPRVNESVLHTLWTMGNCRMSFDAFKARILSALEPTTTNQNYDDQVSSRQATSESAEPVAWRDISTAPRDGTRFIATDGDLAFKTYLAKHYVKWPHEEGGPTFRDVWQYVDSDSVVPWNPTLWTPIPGTSPHPQPLTVEAAAQVLLDKWMHGEFEDDADAIAQDQIDYGGDAADVIEAWLRAIAAKGGQ